MEFIFWGEQGWRRGESACLPPMWPGFDSRTRHHMWVEFVVGSLPCSERFFSRYSGFPLSSKTNISKFQFDLDCQHFCHEPLARKTAQALPVFDIKFAFTFLHTYIWLTNLRTFQMLQPVDHLKVLKTVNLQTLRGYLERSCKDHCWQIKVCSLVQFKSTSCPGISLTILFHEIFTTLLFCKSTDHIFCNT